MFGATEENGYFPSAAEMKKLEYIGIRTLRMITDRYGILRSPSPHRAVGNSVFSVTIRKHPYLSVNVYIDPRGI